MEKPILLLFRPSVIRGSWFILLFTTIFWVHCYKNDSLGHRVWLEVPTVWMKNHRKLRDERRKSTWDSYPNSLDIIGQLVCTYAQQHECRILKCWMKQFAIKCLISQHQKQYWSPNSLHWLHQIDLATSNSLEQFQLVEIKFKLFALVLYCILGLKYVQTCWSKSHLLYWKYQTVGFPSIK